MAEPEVQEPAPRRGAAWRDWRVWLGIAISVASIGYVVRGVPLDEVRDAMARADLWLLIALSVPAYVFQVALRALRWRHLTNPVAEVPRWTLYRAQSLGFMVNNLLPLRLGELLRAWYLARESGASGAAIIGTVVLERVLDVVSLLAVVTGALFLIGSDDNGAGMLSQGARLLVPVAAAPLAGLIALKLAPGGFMAVARWICRPLPPRLGEWVEHALARFAEGLGALSGGSHLFWIVLHSAVIWLVAATLPVYAAVVAFGLDLGGPTQTLVVCWILLAASGVAVSLPSAPGYFGPYQLAFKEVLVRFGVEPATALALGMMVWVVFWITLVVQGLLVAGAPWRSLGALPRQSRKDPAPDRR
ncbi:MAG: lysylphosphatidylglycerol synthase transmembrane domain-containing protein [Myxococcota bacterium]